MQVNSEFIDRIIIAAEKSIQGKETVDVSVVQTLIETLRSIKTQKEYEQIGSTDYQELLNYD
jgi:hypothetical protein